MEARRTGRAGRWPPPCRRSRDSRCWRRRSSPAGSTESRARQSSFLSSRSLGDRLDDEVAVRRGRPDRIVKVRRAERGRPGPPASSFPFSTSLSSDCWMARSPLASRPASRSRDHGREARPWRQPARCRCPSGRSPGRRRGRSRSCGVTVLEGGIGRWSGSRHPARVRGIARSRRTYRNDRLISSASIPSSPAERPGSRDAAWASRAVRDCRARARGRAGAGPARAGTGARRRSRRPAPRAPGAVPPAAARRAPPSAPRRARRPPPAPRRRRRTRRGPSSPPRSAPT